jgi:hypothetical protein
MKIGTIGYTEIPDGSYEGIIGGHELVVVGYEDSPLQTETGIRGIGLHCSVTIKNSKAVATLNI